ncbi:four helix bundle protein [Clostridium sp.]|uniref:four helix bundle protein n=1 Tax=Clostridium sp. TaxID=1506 RepID=UPI0029091772|nr:four helix bundle protein [Clostridium sp.]MDU4478966.1 four helix bundle protein [Clostridium sp.]
MRENIIVNKSFKFATNIIKISSYLESNKRQYVLANQLLRSGTSIGANVKEWVNAISKADFRNKMSIALKEANETEYWLELILYSNIMEKSNSIELLNKCKDLCRILNSIVKNSKEGNAINN